MRLELHRLSLGSGPTGEQRQCNILSVSLRQSPVPPPAQPSSDVIVLNQSLTHLASPVTVIFTVAILRCLVIYCLKILMDTYEYEWNN